MPSSLVLNPAVLQVRRGSSLLNFRVKYNTLSIGYLVDLHNTDDLDWHYSMPKNYGHVARLKGGLFMVFIHSKAHKKQP
jgi:hypothetical protein